MKQKYLIVLSCTIITIAILIYGSVKMFSGISIDEHAYYPVTYVVDGDTFKASIGGKVITVRVLGINTPETVDPRKPPECYGPEASAEGKSLLDGRKIRLAESPHRG